MPHYGLRALTLVSMLVSPDPTLGPPQAIGPPVNVPGGFGTIKGRLVWRWGGVPAQKVLLTGGEAARAAGEPILDKSLVVDPESRGVCHAVVYLAQPNGENPDAVRALTSQPGEVRVKNWEFTPYVSAFHQDQTVRFRSLDSVTHNAHLGPPERPAVRLDATPLPLRLPTRFVEPPVLNRILSPFGTFEAKLHADPRPLPLECDIHVKTRGWVMVFDHPFFAVTGQDGAFEIAGVPAGAQALSVWQERVLPRGPGALDEREVRVLADRVTDVGEIDLSPVP